MSAIWPRGLVLPALLLATAALPAWSQDAVKADRLTVALWPEYDRPAVLVTYRVELSPEVALPAQVDLPIPADVGVPHAVAKLGSDGNLYLAPATREVDGEWAVMRVTTDRPRIHLEYYAPLSVSDDVRSFTYRWRGGMEINYFDYEVLAPPSAVDLVVTPPPSREAISDLGAPLQFGALGTHTAAQQVTVAITYRNPGGRLGVTPAPSSPAVVTPPLLSSSDGLPAPTTPTAPKNNTMRFLLITLGIGAVVLVGLWLARRKP
jgi:hypothetical protein